MTKDQLETWKKLADAATEGPWSMHSSYGVRSLKVRTPFGELLCIASEVPHSDGYFIAASREAVPALIEAVERLTEEFNACLNTMEGINQHMGYQFTQPIAEYRKRLADVWREDEP